MSGFIEIQHDEWVAAEPALVRAHYADLHHRDAAHVHPRERLRQLAPGPVGPRYERTVRTAWGTAVDVYERQHRPDGSIVDQCVAGPHWGRCVVARFRRSDAGRPPGTWVQFTLTQPLRPLVTRFGGRWIRHHLEAELRDFAAQDKAAVERGYTIERRLRVA